MRDLLLGMLARPTSVGWESWLVVLSDAVADPNAWMQAVDGLGLDDQFALLDLLKSTGGIYADALLTLTARQAQDLDDEQLREFVLSDAAEATARLGDRLARHRAVLETLTSRAAEPDSSFGTAAEVAQLEARLHELNAAAVGSVFEQAWHIEAEIIRLEALAQTLESYDAAGRRAVRDELKAQTDQLVAVRDSLESDVAAMTRRRDQAEHDRAKLESDLARRTAERDELSATITTMDSQKSDLARQLVDLNAQVGTRSGEIAQLQKDIAERRQQVEAEAQRLDELRRNPSAQADEQVLTKVNEIYALLPADRAEADFSSRSARSARA